MSTHKTTDKIISKVFKGPSGEGEYGPWQIYNIYFEGSENKYSWFQKDGIVPTPGTKVMFMKYDIIEKEKDGKTYTNYNIKEIEFDTASLGKPELSGTSSHGKQSNNTLPSSNCTMFISYAKDLLVSICGRGEYKEVDYPELVKMYTQEGMRSYYDTGEMLKMDMAMEGAKESEEVSVEAVKKFAKEIEPPPRRTPWFEYNEGG